MFPSLNDSNVYTVDHVTYKPKLPTLQLWHNRLGHYNFSAVKRILSACKVSYKTRTQLCNACLCGKFHQHLFQNSNTQYTAPLQLVYIDIWGPSSGCASNGARYYISFMDAYTK